MSKHTCNHARKGLVSNQQWTNDQTRALFSTATCDQPRCVNAAIREAEKFTGETATFLLDEDRWSDARWLAAHPGWVSPR